MTIYDIVSFCKEIPNAVEALLRLIKPGEEK